jgi:hypothetical protein
MYDSQNRISVFKEIHEPSGNLMFQWFRVATDEERLLGDYLVAKDLLLSEDEHWALIEEDY